MRAGAKHTGGGNTGVFVRTAIVIVALLLTSCSGGRPVEVNAEANGEVDSEVDSESHGSEPTASPAPAVESTTTTTAAATTTAPPPAVPPPGATPGDRDRAAPRAGPR